MYLRDSSIKEQEATANAILNLLEPRVKNLFETAWSAITYKGIAVFLRPSAGPKDDGSHSRSAATPEVKAVSLALDSYTYYPERWKPTEEEARLWVDLSVEVFIRGAVDEVMPSTLFDVEWLVRKAIGSIYYASEDSVEITTTTSLVFETGCGCSTLDDDTALMIIRVAE